MLPGLLPLLQSVLWVLLMPPSYGICQACLALALYALPLLSEPKQVGPSRPTQKRTKTPNVGQQQGTGAKVAGAQLPQSQRALSMVLHA